MHAERMYIEKFGREVLIDVDHPLAVAQRARGSVTADPPVVSAPAAAHAPAATVPSDAPEAPPVDDTPLAVAEDAGHGETETPPPAAPPTPSRRRGR